ETPRSIAWIDWSPWWSRSVAIDEQQVRIVYKTLFGFVPVKVVERPAREFYRIALDVRETSRSRSGTGSGYGEFGRTDDSLDVALDIADLAFNGMSSRRATSGMSYRLALV